MSKPLKDAITTEYRQAYGDEDSVCVIDMTGLNANDTHRLRNDLRAKDMQIRVVKNSLARRAFADSPLEALGKNLGGPCALVTGGESIIDVAKELARWAKELAPLKLKDAIMEGDPELLTVAELAKLKGRLEMLGEIIMLGASPARALVGCLASPASKLAGCMKAMIEKNEEDAGVVT